MNTVWTIGILLFVIIGAVSVGKQIKKLSPVEKEELKTELKNPLVLIAGLIPLGGLLVYVSFAFQYVALRVIAFILIGVGLIIEGAVLSKQTSKGSVLVVLGSATVLITGFFVTKSYW
ncbi:hypothetical protein [Bacillus sp. SG-1]|uniref:hypothetical protein n=1 Tax=Bacillus sp. SG-1 TaxID=161544 RepID=UPI0001544A22|nr:hypothetical protein [Bacillus sp. SG-1]EDL62921.1 hypothetical protein BSG1_18970 [Bacillus sp. SG-1]